MRRAQFRMAISIYITNLKSYLGSKNNCLQLPANSQKPRCAYVIARAILVFKLPASRRQLPANYLHIYLKDCLTLLKDCFTITL